MPGKKLRPEDGDSYVRYGYGFPLCLCDSCCEAQPERREMRAKRDASVKATARDGR